MKLQELRGKYPQYNDLSDADLADAIHQKYYADLSKEEVYNSLGIGTPERTLAGTAQDVAVTATKSVVGLPQSFVGLANIPTGGYAGKAVEGLGVDFARTQQILDDWYSPAQKAAQQRVEEAEGFGGTLKAAAENPSVVGQVIGESAGQMIGGAGVGRLILSQFPKFGAALSAAIGEGAMQAGSSAEESRAGSEDGLLSGRGTVAAVGSGFTTGLFGFMGGKIAQKLGINDVDTVLTSGEFKETSKGFLRRAAEAGFSEGWLEELPQSSLEKVWSNWEAGRPLGEGVPEAGALGVAAGTVMGGVAGGLPGPAKTPENTERNPREDEIVEAPTQPASTPAAPQEVLFTETQDNLAEFADEIEEAARMAREEEFTTPAPEPKDELPPEMVLNHRGDSFDQIFDTMMTREVARNPDNFEDPNTATPIYGRKVARVLGGDPGMAAGLQYGQITDQMFDTANGPLVIQVGEDSYVRPDWYNKAIMAEIYDLAQEFNPRGVYVVLPQDVKTKDSADYGLGAHIKLNGVHYIVPRHATNLTEDGSHVDVAAEAGYNANAKLQMGSTLWHEFGHSLLEDFLLAGAATQEQMLIKQQLQDGIVDPTLLAKLSPEAQSLIRRYADLRQAAESGQMGGHETAARFLAPAKIANERLMKETFRMSPRTMQKTAFGSERIVEPLKEMDWWNFMEFAAEQMAKYQSQPERMEKSGLVNTLFPEGFGQEGFNASLRKFFEPLVKVLGKVFDTLKVRGFVKPEAEFTDWLDALRRQAEGKPAKVKKAKKAKGPTVKEELEAVIQEVNEVDWESPATINTLKSALAGLLRSKVLDRGDPQYGELSRLLVGRQYEEFVEMIEPLLDRKLKFDLKEFKASNQVGFQPAWIFGIGGRADWKPRPGKRFGHPWEKKISSGQGAAIRGWGFYMAENRGTFGSYTHEGPEGFAKLLVNGRFFNRARAVENIEQKIINTPEGKSIPETIIAKTEWAVMAWELAANIADIFYPNGWYADKYEAESRDTPIKYDPKIVDRTYRKQEATAVIKLFLRDYWQKTETTGMRQLKSMFSQEELTQRFTDLLVPDLVKAKMEFQKFNQPKVQMIEVLAPEDHFLNQDVTVSEQSDYVKEALNKLPKWAKSVLQGNTLDGDKFSNAIMEAHRALENRGNVKLSLNPNEVESTLSRLIHTQIRGSGLDMTALERILMGYTGGGQIIAILEELGEEKILSMVRKTDAYGHDVVRSLEQIIARMYPKLQNREGFSAIQKKASQILQSTGIAGSIYFDSESRDGHSKKQATRNAVVFSSKNLRVIATDKAGHGFSLDAQKVAEAKARKEWKHNRTNSQNFRKWFGDSKVKTPRGKPLPVWYTDGMDLNLNGTQVSLVAQSPLDEHHLVGVVEKRLHGRPTVPGYVKMEDPYVVETPAPISPTIILKGFLEAQAKGHDGVMLRTGSGVFWAVINPKENFAYDPDHVNDGQWKFDRTKPEGEEMANIADVLKNKFGMKGMRVMMHKLANSQFWALQLQQLAHIHPDWNPLVLWEKTRRDYYRKVAEMHSLADGVSRQLAWAGKETLAQLQKFTEAEYKYVNPETKEREHWTDIHEIRPDHYRHVPNAKTYEMLKKFGVDVETRKGKKFLQLYIDAKNALQFQQDKMQEVMQLLVSQKYRNSNLKVRLQKRAEVTRTFDVLRKSPFWPQQTFGENVVQVWRTDENGKFLVYESASNDPVEADRKLEAAKRKYPKDHVVKKYRNQEEGVIMRLPLEFADEVANALGLDPNSRGDQEAIQNVRDLMGTLYSSRPFTTYDPQKALIEGGSKDFLRNFADFALRNANFIAKMEYRKRFNIAISDMDAMIAQGGFADSSSMKAARDLMFDSVEYMMNPVEEAQQARAVMALLYLWGNVKTAALNFWGLTHTLLFLNQELGYVKGGWTTAKSAGAALRTMGYEGKDIAANWLQGAAEAGFTSVTDPNWQMVDGQPTELRHALEQAKRENVLDQSYAYYLAGQALKGDLTRMAARSVGGKMFKGTVDLGMAPFRVGELAIRRTTFIALYSALQQSRPELTPEQRYQEAVRLVGVLQGDYTKGNRPRIMRGTVMSLITLFMTFVHNAAWGAYGGVELGVRRQNALESRANPAFYRSYTIQMGLLMLGAAGMMGWPFMENIVDVLNLVYKRIYGSSLQGDLQKLLAEQLGDEKARMLMHGAMYDIGGINVSRSISLGRVIPGTDTLAAQHRSSQDFMGDVVASATGIGGGYVSWALDTGRSINRVVNGANPLQTTIQHIGRLPGGVGNMFRAAEWEIYGARGPNGGLIAWDEGADTARDVEDWEIRAKALGFQPTSVSRGQDIKADINDAIAYWDMRRSGLLKELDYATAMEDRETIADVKKRIGDFNEEVPSRAMRIDGKSIKRSLETRKRLREGDTELNPQKKMYREIAEQARQKHGAQ